MDALSLHSVEDCDWIRHQFGQAAFDELQARYPAGGEAVAVSTLIAIADEVYSDDIQLLKESRRTCCQSADVEIVNNPESAGKDDE